MSIKDRLAKKTEGLLPPESKAEKGAITGPALRTGPGQMLMVNALTKENKNRIAQLEEKVKEFDGALPARRIDPNKIFPSKWANRIEKNFSTSEYERLKLEIAGSGGNVQPIKVRRLDSDEDRYEIVFGHRRHRACLELGLPVLAIIEDLDDQELFKAMDRENRERLNLAPWEQGRMYRNALNEGLFRSISELAREVGMDKGNLSKALALADLPQEIIDAFPSPLDLQFNWAPMLKLALEKDRENVVFRAQQLRSDRSLGLSAKEVLKTLIGKSKAAARILDLTVGGAVVGKIVIDSKAITVEFTDKALLESQVDELKLLLERFLGKT